MYVYVCLFGFVLFCFFLILDPLFVSSTRLSPSLHPSSQFPVCMYVCPFVTLFVLSNHPTGFVSVFTSSHPACLHPMLCLPYDRAHHPSLTLSLHPDSQCTTITQRLNPHLSLCCLLFLLCVCVCCNIS